MYITAIVPAHNEEKSIVNTVNSLKEQVDQIIVACDNCTDHTFKNSIETGAQVFATKHNTARKAGALNQALERYVNWNKKDQYIFICDADTIISKNWVKRAKTLIETGGYDAIGSIFKGDADRNSMLQFCQQMEWCRYSNQIKRRQKVFVLTGTASMISARSFEKVHEMNGYYYDENSITEDFSLTLDLKKIGAKIISPMSCSCTTEIMPTWRLLFLQRRRWYLGALQQTTRRKWDRVLFPYVTQQFMLILSVFAFMSLIAFTTYLMLHDMLIFNFLWLFVGIIFALERVVTVWNQDRESKLFAAMLFPELIYSFFLQVAYIGAWLQLVFGSIGTWHHVTE